VTNFLEASLQVAALLDLLSDRLRPSCERSRQSPFRAHPSGLSAGLPYRAWSWRSTPGCVRLPVANVYPHRWSGTGGLV